jgi:tripartite-type tricarboxylate transporter receptor subunit TctC
VFIGGYKSASEGILAVIRGEAEFSSCAASVAMQYLRSGQLRPFMAIDEKRSPEFPDVTSIAEAGHPDLGAFATDYWVMAPPGVPKARSKILEDALMKTLKDPDFLKWAKNSGVDLLPVSGAETAKKALKLFGLVGQYKGDIEIYTKQ